MPWIWDCRALNVRITLPVPFWPLVTSAQRRHGESAVTHRIRAILVTALLPGLVATTGCALQSYKSLSREQQAAVRSVSITRSVALPEVPMVFGPSVNAGGFLFGPLALAGAMSSDNPDAQALRKHFADHKIDLGEIVREEFIARLAQIRAFPAVDVAQGDANFELTVESYGLSAKGSTFLSPINHPLIPTLRLGAKLTARNGEVLWVNHAHLPAMDVRIEGHMFEEILANPDQTREAFRKAAEIVSGDLLKDFGVHPASVH